MKSFARIAGFALACFGATVWFSNAQAQQWVSIGPSGLPIANHDVISGQVNVLAVDPRDANVIYIGAAEGGVWKTRDGGASWIPLTDTQLVRPLGGGQFKATMSIGALAIDPGRPQTIYAGTGDPNIACCFVGPGLGVFRSADGGSSWVPTGADPFRTGCSNGAMGLRVVKRILVVPGRQSVVFAATDLGVYRYREDGSDCWISLANGIPMFGNATDMVADPYQGVLYVAIASQGIFKSSDLSGGQWQQLGNGLPTSGSGFGRIALAFGGRTGVGFSQPLPLVYAGFASPMNTYRLFTTRDGGGQWTELPSPPHDGQLGFNNVIAVGSYNSDEVYIGQIAFWRSLDGGRKGGANDFKQNPPVTGNSWTVLGCCQTLPNPWRKGLDVHGDIHDIVFAPYGSFLPDPSQIEIVYVANDGGITKGTFDFEGVVTWVPLTGGLAIGQAGTIGLDPNDQSVSAAGYWHNGDALTNSPSLVSRPFGGGDGFGARIDAGNFRMYINCNAGFDGSICRAHGPTSVTAPITGGEGIWAQGSGGKHWSDPHRPGHLVRLQAGLLFRTKVADTAAPNVLKSADAWDAIDPFFGKTGATTTMAFRSRVLEEQPVYYLGTNTGQIWRGSPEVGWTKVCECGRSVNTIAADLFSNERIFAVFAGTIGPGRIKQLTRLANGTWGSMDIDATFAPQLTVSTINTVVVDPAMHATQGTVVYVGTDQGVYRGFHGKPVVAAFAAPGVLPPTAFNNWTWHRSAGVPNVAVTELQVHQNFQTADRSGVLRAATYGRGLYELNRALPAPNDKLHVTLTVRAMRIGEDGAPPSLDARIVVTLQGKRYEREAPFEIAPDEGADIVLEAPAEMKEQDAVLAFVGWTLPGGRRSSERRISVRMNDAVEAIANYEEARLIPDEDAKPLRVVASASARQMCVQNFTHELLLSWQIVDGQRPASVRAEITYPDRHVENVDFKPLEGSLLFPMSAPTGGAVSVRVIATDATGKPALTEVSARLEACGK